MQTTVSVHAGMLYTYKQQHLGVHVRLSSAGSVHACCVGEHAEVMQTSDVQTAFTGVDLVVMLAKLDRKVDDDDPHERLKNVVTISRQHGAAIDKYANKTVRVIDLNYYHVPTVHITVECRTVRLYSSKIVLGSMMLLTR